MKTPVAKIPAKKRHTIDVTIAVTKFKDVLASDALRGASDGRGGRGTDYIMTLPKNDPLAEIRGNDIYIKPPGAILRFTITSARRGKTRYFPVGITYVREGDRNTSDEQRLGLLNFPQSEIYMRRQTLMITDSYKDKTKCVRYKFSVIVQRGSDGKIGIIDPGIVHEFD